MLDSMDHVWDAELLIPETHIAHTVVSSVPGLRIASRIIEDFELVLITQGEGDYILPDRTIRFCTGGLIVTPPYLRHEYRGLGQPNGHHAIHFDPAPGYSRRFAHPAGADEKFSGQPAAEVECQVTTAPTARVASLNEPPVSMNKPGPPSVAVQVGGQHQCAVAVRYVDQRRGVAVDIPHYIPYFPVVARTLFQDVVFRHEEFRRDLLASAALRLNATLMSILAMIVEACSACGTGSGRTVHSERRSALARAAAIMDNRYAEDLSIPELAAVAGYAPNYFSGEFGRAYGLSPVEYLRERRLVRARELLRTSAVSVKEIAMLVGYDDPLYFSKVFSNATGLSPTKYRCLANPGWRPG
jgi:AraC-like DNA-binding protein